MNIAVIGLGSMGKRRIRLLKQHFTDITIQGVDLSEIRREESRSLFGIAAFPDLESAMNAPCECAFVCTAPLSHSGIITQCLTAGLHVFTELNLVSDGYRENIGLAERNGKTLFLSSTFLYRNDIGYLINEIHKAAPPLFYTYHVGQYLPDWHPWESFKDFFVGERRTGGIREILAIEIPWLISAFGDIEDMSVRCRSMSSLQLPYKDTYWLHFSHKSGAEGQLTLDLVSRVPVRHFEAFGEGTQLEWRGKPESLWTALPDYSAMGKVDLSAALHRQAGYRDFIVEDAYLEEIRAFFAAVNGARTPAYTFADDLRVLDVIDRILEEGY